MLFFHKNVQVSVLIVLQPLSINLEGLHLRNNEILTGVQADINDATIIV